MEIPKKVLVVGLGKHGISAARYFANKGSTVVVTDKNPEESHSVDMSELKDLPIQYALGQHDVKLFEDQDLIIPSPGVDLKLPGFVKAAKKKVPIMGDVEIASQFIDIPIIAVSGTNGKTVCAALIFDMLEKGGKRAILSGDMGTPMIDLVEPSKNNDLIVAELSSFQLDTTTDFKPAISVLLNVTEDHAGRYKSMLEYIKAMGKIFKNMSRDNFSVINANDKNCVKLSQNIKTKKCLFNSQKTLASGLYSDGAEIFYKAPKVKEKYKVQNSHLHGVHNQENIMAAIAVARYLGVSDEKVQYSLDSFLGLHHRIEFIRDLDGVTYYNDSKANNVNATNMALMSFPDNKVFLIMGGQGKKANFKSLAKPIGKKVRHCFLIGENAAQIKKALGKSTKVTIAETLEKAVYLATLEATWGDSVLLSPACSGEDQFESFQQRGDAFKGQIMRL